MVGAGGRLPWRTGLSLEGAHYSSEALNTPGRAAAAAEGGAEPRQRWECSNGGKAHARIHILVPRPSLVHPTGQKDHSFHLWLTHHMCPLPPPLLIPRTGLGWKEQFSEAHSSVYPMPGPCPSPRIWGVGLDVLLSQCLLPQQSIS